MGNKIARTTQASASEYYLQDLPSSYNLVLKEVLGRGRFLKSIQCKHDEGLLLVKVYFKRGDSIDLKEYERRLSQIREIFLSLQNPHVWPFQQWLETDKAVYLLRQYLFNNLHDRLSTRPFLNLIEKKWLAFQLLYAVKQCHGNAVCHGDIKCENVLVTSWNWLYLADFASFKPTYIPHDDPSDFSFFFDTGGRRRCYLAPERFYEHSSEILVAPDAPLIPSMDIFSVGCVIAELFLEGHPLFELSQLLAYRRGQHDPSPLLEKIPDLGIRRMILHMIQLDPDSRLSAESYLQSYETTVFPGYFSPFLHNFFSCLIPMDSDSRIVAAQRAFYDLHKKMMNKSNEEISTRAPSSTIDNEHSEVENIRQNSYPQNACLRKNEDLEKGSHHNTRLVRDLEENKTSFRNKTLVENKPMTSFRSSSAKSSFLKNFRHSCKQSPGELLKSIFKGFKGRDQEFLGKIIWKDLDSVITEHANDMDTSGAVVVPEHNVSCEGMVLIASLLCSCIRSVKQPQLRRLAVLLLKFCSLCINDEDRLQRVLPYVIAMLSDPAAIVRCAAVETLCEILPLVRDFPPSDAKIFPEYILPMLSMLPDDSEESVRICYASNISKLALTAYRFLMQSQSLNEGAVDKSNLEQNSPSPSTAIAQQIHNESSDTQLSHLRKAIAEVVQEMVMGPKQTPNIRRALLQNIGNLCCFFGKKQSNDFLLPILPAFLNDRDELLRAVFFGKIVFVCFFVGQRSVEEYLLPYIEQALSDTTEAVLVNTLECLSLLCKSRFLRKRILLEMIQQASLLLLYPSQWVRRFAVTFIAACSENLGAVDSYVYLAPVIRESLSRQVASLASERSLLSCLKPSISRHMFYQVVEKGRMLDMLGRQRRIWYNPSLQSKEHETMDVAKKGLQGVNPILGSTGRDPSLPDFKSGNSSLQQSRLLESTEHELRPMGSLIRNSPNANVRDTLSSDKLQFSAFISSHGGGTGLDCDGSSEGIPLYSFSMDKRAVGDTSAGSNSSSQGVSVTSSSSMHWMDQSNKSLSLASSAPKLVPGSFSINNSSKQLYKAFHDFDGRENGQLTCIGSKFQDMGISSSRKSSQTVDVASPTDAVGLPSFARPSSMQDTGWRPRGVLVAHLQEHKSAVNDIAISNDNCFFVSASNDSTVKIWDTRKLEKDISFRSRLTYPLHGSRALCAAVLRSSAQIVVGASDGTIHTFSVDYISRGLGNVVEKYSNFADIKKREIGEGSILNLLNYSADGSPSQMVMYSTQNCGIHLWDTRADSTTWTLKGVPEEGYVSSLVTGPCGNWFVSGSSRGVLTLWDMRFLVPVNSWKYSTGCPIEKMCLYIPPSNTAVPATGRPLVYVAAGVNEVSLWNAENGSCHQILRMASNEGNAEMSDLPWALARHSNKSSSKQDMRRNMNPKYQVDELNDFSSRLLGIRSLLPLPGGDLLTGGTDLRIRRWDHLSPDRSYCVCGPSLKGARHEEFYETKSNFGVQVVQETNRRPQTPKELRTAAATDSAGCHRDSITSLASVKLNQRLLISSSRDGAIKVWK